MEIYMGSSDFISVWPWSKTPLYIREHIKNRDDIDWVALVPLCYKNSYIPWLESDSFGCCDIEIVETSLGQLYIGYHA